MPALPNIRTDNHEVKQLQLAIEQQLLNQQMHVSSSQALLTMQQQVRRINCSGERAMGGMGSKSRKILTTVTKHEEVDCNIDPDDEHGVLQPQVSFGQIPLLDVNKKWQRLIQLLDNDVKQS